MVILQTVLPVSPSILTAVSAEPMPVNSSPTSPVQTPSEPVVIVNRTVPVVTSAPKNLPFSENPTDAEISQSHTFGQPLIPIGATTLEENKALAVALTHFRNRTNDDDVGALAGFLSSHATSAWNAALLLNLGTVYRHTGWFSKALDAWEQSWALAKDETDSQAKDVADTAVSELIELNARLGRYERLEVLFSEVAGRRFDPALNQKIQASREGLWLMKNRPQDAFRCGPLALAQIGSSKGMPVGEFTQKIYQSRSSLQGISLTSVYKLANDLGMNYQMAWRTPGSAIILPAVIHWKAGHYAALIRKSGDNYLIKDPTFGEDIWISRAALDGEGSGYCLVASGNLPVGWRTVGTAEGQTIFGKGSTGKNDPSRTRPTDTKTCQPPCCPMAQYSVHLMLVSLNIVDTPVGYTPPRGPDMHFQVTYNQKEGYPNGATPPVNFGYSNLGSQWTFNWMAYIIDDPINTANDAYYFVQGGGYEDYTGFNATSQSYAVQPDSQAVLIRTSSTSYERDLPDGSKQIFSQADGSASYPRRIFLTQIKDAAGNTQTLTYNSVAGGFQLVAATDAIGQVTLITNELSSDPFKITKVTDPFGRAARFKYNGSGQLTNITDIIGINSSFTYDWHGAVLSQTTPYGSSTFTYGQNGRDAWFEATDPLGQKERVEFVDTSSVIPTSDPSALVPTISGLTNINLYLEHRNSFYWDKKAMQLYPGDYTKARIYHWLHTDDYSTCTGIIESSKNPLEVRVWRDYPGQPNSIVLGTNNFPSTIARVLDDGSSQVFQYQYNLIGKPTLVIDPTNRTTGFVYDANNVDLLQVYQMAGTTSSNVLGQFTYNSQHLPLTTVDAAGRTSFFGYNANGQLLALTNALNEIVLLKYNTNGYLTNIVTGTTTSLLSTNKFTYDGYGRVRTMTDPLGYTVTASYDAADRPTNITYLDGTYQQVVYNFLDPVLARDRNGHWTSMIYDPLRHLTDTYDNLGRHTQFGWCGCGSLESITDPLNNVTAWVRDLQGRVQTKIYPDLTQINYAYETNSSRLHSVTDAKSQSTLYSYFIDDNLQQITYSNAVVATPSVSFTYDTNYNRVTTMTDGTGVTTYRYYNVTNGQLGAGMLSSVSNSFIGSSSVIAYNYDALGRITNRAINGVSQQVAFDALHRVMLVTNVLGRFTNTYVGGTMLLSTNFAPNGKKTIFSYLSITNDERLAEILNQKTNSVTLSKFDYAYDPVGQITNWTQQADAATPTAYTYQYDAGNQILNAVLKSTGVGATVLKQYAYGYDLAGNRTSEQIDTGMSQSSYNSANQLTSKTSGSGPMQFAGTVNEQATVTVGGNAATVNHTTTNFTGYANVSSGTNVVPVTATDYSGNSLTNKYQLVVTNNGVAKTITYDLNGNETNVVTATSTNAYQWDAANRLLSITGPTNQSLFTYDGLGRRVQIIELTNGVAYATNKFLWDGMELCEQRNSTGGSVTKRFFGGGEQISGTNYYFTRDHLGNIREMVDNVGVIQVRYDYDPYGRQTKISGSLDADFGYAGMYRHAVSGLNLTLYRAYDSDLGRWPNQDPIGEAGGLNLYGYVGNDPINAIDPLGLAFGDYWDIGATMDYYAQVQATSDSGFARTGAQLANLLLGFSGASDAQKAGQTYADPCSSFGDKLKITGKLGIDVAGDAIIAWRGLGALGAPNKLYHFTSGVRGAEINATGVLNPGAGLFGNGVYLSTSTSATVATLQGAHSTEAVVQVASQGLSLVPTWVPGSFRVVGGSIALP